MAQAGQRDVSRKLQVLSHVKESGNVSQTCRSLWFLPRDFLSVEEGL